MLQATPLNSVHQALGGKLVDFSGWHMPLHYGSQIEEHHAVRQGAGVFDVSHMTVVDIHGDDARAFLRYLLANDVDKLKVPGKALYTAMLNNSGGVIDDLIVYWLGEHYRLVVNCATRDKDMAWIESKAKDWTVTIEERSELAMLAVQGPKARAVVDGILTVDALTTLTPFQGLDLTASGRTDWLVARTGYTGEDGYEIILPDTDAVGFWEALIAAGVRPCGLGARDTLRLEAGMNLYGHEMDDETSPLVANMAWTVAWKPEDRDFIGREALVAYKAAGVMQKLVGLLLQDKGVLRAGQEVIIEHLQERGVITSGTFSPTLGYSIALARVPVQVGEACEVQVRNKRLTVNVVAPSFVRNGQSLV